MIKCLKNNQGILSKCYLVILVIAAFFFKETILHGFIYSDVLGEEELILFWKVTPWTLTPMLVCTLLAAFFTDKGHGTEVGLAGILILFASSIILTGSTLWASKLNDGKMLLTQLNGYRVHMPIAVFLVSASFLRGGAVALLLSVLSSNRASANAEKEIRWQTISAIVVCILSITIMELVRPQLTWTVATLLGASYILMLVPGFYCFKNCIPGPSEQSGRPGEDNWNRYGWILPVVILSVCLLTITSYWQYVTTSWRYHNYRLAPPFYLAMNISSLAFVIGLFIFGKRTQKGIILAGAILLLSGLPLGVQFIKEFPLEFIPMIMIGTGLAMIVGPTLGSVIRLPVRRYALAWVGIVSAIIILCKLMLVLFNRMAVAFDTHTIAVYIVYPLLALSLMVLGYLFNEKKRKAVEHE